MSYLKPKDIIAFTTLIGIGVLKLKGMDGTLDGVAGLILGYYFAHRTIGDDSGH